MGSMVLIYGVYGARLWGLWCSFMGSMVLVYGVYGARLWGPMVLVYGEVSWCSFMGQGKRIWKLRGFSVTVVGYSAI